MEAEQAAVATEIEIEIEGETDGEAGVPDPTGVEVVEVRGAGGLEAFLRVGADPRLYRIAPTRDPRQPRFWCLVAVECSPTGLPETGQPIWAGAWETKREELPTVIGTIRTDVRAWLAETPQAALRQRLDVPRPPAVPFGTPSAAHAAAAAANSSLRPDGRNGQAGGGRASGVASRASGANGALPPLAADAGAGAGAGQSS